MPVSLVSTAHFNPGQLATAAALLASAAAVGWGADVALASNPAAAIAGGSAAAPTTVATNPDSTVTDVVLAAV